MDICYPTIDFDNPPEGADTMYIQDAKNFNDNFRKYFPDGIKMFSTITEVDWIFYELNYKADLIEYYTKTREGLDFYVSLPDSLSKFQRKSDADFLLLLHYGGFIGNTSDTSKGQNKYSSIFEMEYSIWNRKDSDLVTKDRVQSRIEFDRVVNNWPYRAAIIKSAALIFEKLPMFEK